MSIENRDEVSEIMDYIKFADLKGSIEVGDGYFWWKLGDVELYFCLDSMETTVEYFRRKNKMIYLGHTHCDNADALKLIQGINSGKKMLKITVTPLFSTFSVVDATTKKKKSRFLVQRYYSI